MKTIAGLLTSRSGVITFTGEDVTAIEAQDLVGRGIEHPRRFAPTGDRLDRTG